MFGERWNRWSGPIAIALALLVLVGLIGLVALLSGNDRSLAKLQDRVDPGDRAVMAGTVRDVFRVSPEITALTIYDDSTRKHPLLVLSGDPESAQNADGKHVELRGTIERFDPAALGSRYHVTLDTPQLRPFDGQPVVITDSLREKSDPDDRARS